MRDFTKMFSRRYSAVNSDDDQQQYLAGHMSTATSPAAMLQRSTLADAQRRKSLKAMGTMHPAGILSSFFNERQKNKRARSPKCAFLLLAIGVLAITTAVLVKIFQPYDLIFKWKLIMSDNGEIFNLWAKPPVDLYIKIYLFNITNAEAFLAGREPMNVEQVGPYVYKELMSHENVTFNENGTVSTNPSHPLVWQEDMSEGHKEDDMVVMVNIAMLAIAHMTSDKSFFMRMGLKTLFATSKSQPLVRMTAKEFMFGFPSSLTTLGNAFLPNWIHFDKVGLIDRMYDFENDYETFHTGVDNVAISGLYATYRGSTNLPQWTGDHCSNIELASDGTKFRSFLQANDSVKFFRKSMCRPINLYRVGEAEKHGTLSGYKYVFEKNAFDNGAINPENKCFCRKGKCQPQGLIDVSDCYYGFPISLSYPHFMDGDPGLQNNLTGLEPSKEKHSSAFVIQPQSGLPLSISAKVQINMHFEEMSVFTQLSPFSHLTVPMLWFDIMMPRLPQNLDTRFNFYLNILPYIDILGFWGGLLLGVVLLVYAVTRATIRMSNFSQSGISPSKYCKASLLRSSNASQGGTGAAGGGVYNPCEMTLMETNEKPLMQKGKQQHVITRSDEEEEEAMMYTEIDLRRKSFALDLEPALSDTESSDDEGHESDTGTLSRNSTSSSCMDEQGADYHAAGGHLNRHSKKEKNSVSFGSSGLASSITDSHDGIGCSSTSSGASSTGRRSSHGGHHTNYGASCWSVDASTPMLDEQMPTSTARAAESTPNSGTTSPSATSKSRHSVYDV